MISVISRAQPAVVQLIVTSQEENSLTPYRVPTFKEYRSSGFFASLNGNYPRILVTNAHVVDGAEQIYFQSANHQRIPVRLLAISRQRDIALCLSDDTDGPTLNLSSRGELPLGSSVVSLGYPFGDESIKVTNGIISGYDTTNKKNSSSEIGIEDLTQSSPAVYQITAPLNYGNSGGALLDTSGDIVGITVGGEPGAQSVGYAIPVSAILSLIPLISTNPEILLPNWGFCWSKTTPQLFRSLTSMEPIRTTGIYIRSVQPDSTLVGLQHGDLLVSINDDVIGSDGRIEAHRRLTFLELDPLIPINSPLHLQVVRNKKLISLRSQYRYQPTSRIREIYPALTPPPYKIFAGGCWSPVTVNILEALPPEHRSEVNSLDLYQPALILTSILPRSQLEQEGLFRVGSVLSTINGHPVHTLKDLDDHLTGDPSDPLLFESRSGVIMALTSQEIRHQDLCLRQTYSI